MPELPEVETVRLGLDKALRKAVIQDVQLKRAGLRIPFPKDLGRVLHGRTITRISRRAKYLLWHFDSRDVLIAHLGMTGRFSVDAGRAKLQPHDHMVMPLTDGRQIIFNDARRFGLITLASSDTLESHPLLAHLGPEPLDKAFAPAYLRGKLAARKGAVKAALMDQEVVVGVGNIYANEALFLAGVKPQRRACDTLKQCDKMVEAIRHVLRQAIASGGSSLRDFLHVSGETGYFQHHFSVYDRENEPCVTCKKPIRNIRIAGRSSFFCASCQK